MAARDLRVGDYAYHYWKNDEAERVETTCLTCSHTTYEYDRSNLHVQVSIDRFKIIGVGENCYFYTFLEHDDRSSDGGFWHSVSTMSMDECFASPDDIKIAMMGGQGGKRVLFEEVWNS